VTGVGPGGPTAPEPAADRLARLVDRLLASAESAALAGAWARVAEISADILAADPDNERATALARRAAPGRGDGHRALVTMLFADIAQSTELLESRGPEAMRDVLRIYRNAATESIDRFGGSILQFAGDGVVASFGHPVAHEDDAQRAVLAGLALLERVAASGPQVRAALGTDVAVRVGVHSGRVVVAELTAGESAPDIVGSAANVAARLQSEARTGTIVISDATRRLVEDTILVAPLGTRALKGLGQPMDVFEVVRPRAIHERRDQGGTADVPLIGRASASGQLAAAWAAVRDGADQRAVVVHGPPGIGKTRLVNELRLLVESDGGVVLWTGCLAYHQNVALWPIAHQIERALGLLTEADDHDRLAVLSAHFDRIGIDRSTALPLIAPLLNLETGTPPLSVDPMALRAQTLEVLVRWLAVVASRAPTLVVVEDLQWADPSTLELLDLLARSPVPGLAIVVTSRDPLDAPWGSMALDIGLAPLTTEDTERLALALVGGLDLPDERRQLLVERSGGVPLFLEELARTARNASEDESIPLRVQELLASRLRAEGIDLRVAQLAATIGSEFDLEVLRTLSGGEVDVALAALGDAGIVEPVEGDPARFRFTHVLLRDAAYETQVLDGRQQAHASIARVLDARPDASLADAVLTAHHLDLAGEPGDAMPAYIRAAQLAQRSASHAEARRLLDRALELTAAQPGSPERDISELTVRMLRSLSTTTVGGYAHPDALVDFEAADTLSRRHLSRPEVFPAHLAIWAYFFTRGDHVTASLVIERLRQVTSSAEGAWFSPEAGSCVGFQEFFGGNLALARASLEAAWEGYMSRDDANRVSPFWPLPNDSIAVTSVALAVVTGLQGFSRESDLWEAATRKRCAQLPFPQGPFTLGMLTVYMAWLRLVCGDVEGARRYGDETLGVATTHRLDYFGVIGRPYALAPSEDRWSPPAEVEASLQALDVLGQGGFRPAYLATAAATHHRSGDADRALELLADALELADKGGEPIHRSELLRLRAQVSLASGRSSGEVADLREAVAIALEQGAVVLALRAAVDLAQLPDGVRPADWRDVLAAVWDRVPTECTIPAAHVARALLSG
jgi:class 3 adenylate cyclase